MTTTAATLAAVALLVTTSGCGGTRTASTTAANRMATTTSRSSAALLTAAVRAGVIAHHRLSVRVLWSNQISARPQAIAGPALADLRSSVTARRKRHIRIRLESERFRIVSIRLDPSYATAFAVVADPQRVRPYSYAGRPLGRAVTLNEHARIELRRRDQTQRFVVWKVTAIR